MAPSDRAASAALLAHPPSPAPGSRLISMAVVVLFIRLPLVRGLAIHGPSAFDGDVLRVFGVKQGRLVEDGGIRRGIQAWRRRQYRTSRGCGGGLFPRYTRRAAAAPCLRRLSRRRPPRFGWPSGRRPPFPAGAVILHIEDWRARIRVQQRRESEKEYKHGRPGDSRVSSHVSSSKLSKLIKVRKCNVNFMDRQDFHAGGKRPCKARLAPHRNPSAILALTPRADEGIVRRRDLGRMLET